MTALKVPEMDDVHEAATLSVHPPQLGKPKKSRRYTKDEWEAQRPIIVGMYPIKGMTLESIADILKERGFVAT